jgi:hypothetical protein
MGFHYMEKVTRVYLKSWRKPEPYSELVNYEAWRRYHRYARYCVQFSDGFGYYSLPNVGLHGVRTLQRWWRRCSHERRQRALAVMMAFHERLGHGSLLKVLDVDLVRRDILLLTPQ